MRIAHIITRMIVGGAQENTLVCCQDLRRLFGDEAMLITGPAIGPEGDLLERQDAGNVPVELVRTLRRAINPLWDLRAARDLKSILRRFNPDVVHTHSAKAGLLGRRAAWSLQVPVVVHTVHGAPFHPYQSAAAHAFFRACEKHAAARCHMLVSVADAMTEQLVAAGVAPREKFRTVYSGMDVEPFLHAADHRAAARRELGLDDHHILVGKVARMFHLKGHQYVVEAAERVIRAEPATHFVLVGDGILRAPLQQKIDDAGMHDHFHFTGLVDPSEIPKWIGAMDILVHASLREGLARALPQALIAGKPVVSYDVDGAREVVIPGETGFLTPPRSVEPLAAALLQLVRTPALRIRLGMTGRNRFTDRFRHESMTRQLHELYGQLQERAGEGRGGRAPRIIGP